METTTFADAQLKIRRAKEHRDTLAAALQRWLDEDNRPYSLSVTTDPKSGEQVVRIGIEKTPPPEWGTIVGDILHNLRSALDNIIHELTLLNTGRELTGTEFPIFIDESRFRHEGRGGGLYKIRGLNQPAQDLVERVQPFKYRDRVDPAEADLWILHRLSITDKHLLLNSTGVISGVNNLRLYAGGAAIVDKSYVRPDGLVDDGAELVRWRVSLPPGSKGHVTIDGQIAYDVAFDQTGPAKGVRVIFLLDILGNTVAAILKAFAEGFER